MTPTTASAAAAVAADTAMETLALKLTEICNHAAEDYPWDPPRRFTVLAQRLQLLVAHLSHPGVLPSSPAFSTALRGIAGDVSAAVSTLSSYRSRSRVYVLIHCLPLCSSLRSLCSSLAPSLALLDAPLSSQPDLQKRASDLARDFLLADLRVTETEERVYSALQREGEARESGKKAVQSGIIMDLARALGAGPEALADQIKLLRSDLTGPSTSATERRILVSLEKIFGSWSATEPCVSDRSIDVDFDENATIPPFKNFLCPLTKVVMKDPVVLESLQTYERAEIKHWFDWCLEDGRDPTCPVTGQVLKSLELKPNIGLAGAIEEWVNRNIEVLIKSAVQYLGEEPSSSLECVERALENVYRISEEHPTSRYKVRNAGIISLVVKMLKEQSKVLGSELRTKALMVMDSMAKDHESKGLSHNMGLRQCEVCEEAQAKYKCPSCLVPYCSVACCRKHKENPCQKSSPPLESVGAQSLSKAAELLPVRSYQVEESSWVPGRELLESIVESKEIRDSLQNTELLNLIKSICCSKNPEDELDEAMKEQNFRDFTEKMLSIVSPQEQDP